MNMKIEVLIACEESQIVCKEFRKLGYEAYSCDILSESGGKPEWHIQKDVLEVIKEHPEIRLMIAHPPCTLLAVTGNKWYYHPDDKHLPTDQRRPHPRFPDRKKKRQEAIDFFMALINASIPHIAVENPVGIMSTVFRKPNQYVQPYWFDNPHSKKTGLWLKNLPLLEKTNVVEPQWYVYKDGRRDPLWHVETMKLPAKERSIARSKTFSGLAKQFAVQYSKYITEFEKIKSDNK